MSSARESVRIGRAFGAALYGIEAARVEVQAARAPGLPRAAIIGQAGSEVREARERLKVAMQAQGLWSGKGGEHAIVINLAPAGLPKTGTGLDLPMCLATVSLTWPALQEKLDRVLAYAEVGLDGTLRAAAGTLSAAIAAHDAGFSGLVVPPAAAREAAEVKGLDVIAVRTLADAVCALRGDDRALAPWPPPREPAARPSFDLSDVKGQAAARRALEVAAAGGHNLLLIGPPGSGKTLLSRRLATILPPLGREESLEVTRIHSAAGLLGAGAGVVAARPFRAPHHSVSPAGLVGGGVPPRPGEVSLATHGVLFLDELPEFRRHVLEVLRQPLEDGWVSIVRAMGRAVFPARFLLVGAMNPCPCGWHGATARPCPCTPREIDRYRGRISGPLLDRIDMHVHVPAVSAADLARTAEGEPSAPVRERVVAARAVQEERNAPLGAAWNAHLAAKHLPRVCRLTPPARRALDAAMARMGLSARAHDRILKVARTLADLADRDEVGPAQVAEAVGYRSLDRTSTPEG